MFFGLLGSRRGRKARKAEKAPRSSPPHRPVSVKLEALEDRLLPALTAAVFDPQSASWYLHDQNTAGAPTVPVFRYGAPGATPVLGDWDGKGTATIGVVDPDTATWYLKNANHQGEASYTPFRYGAPGWLPVVGDWDGNGSTTIGMFDPSTATWYLRNHNSAGAPDVTPFRFGAPGWLPVVGDWNGDGHTSIGVFNPATATFYLRNENSAGAPDAGSFRYGTPGSTPVAGDWKGSGHAGVGVFDVSSATWYMRSQANPGAPDEGVIRYGGAGWQPVVSTGHAKMPLPGPTGTPTAVGSTPAPKSDPVPAVNPPATSTGAPTSGQSSAGTATTQQGSASNPLPNPTGTSTSTPTPTSVGGTPAPVQNTPPPGQPPPKSDPAAVVNPQPTITGGPSSGHGPEGTAITLQGSVSNSRPGEQYTYGWQVLKTGNAFASGSNPQFTFTPDDNGTYQVTLTATDQLGRSGTTSETITADNVAPSVTAPAGQSANQGSAVSFTLGSFSDPGKMDNPWAVDVNWGDGSSDTTFTLAAAGSLGTQPHTYQHSGHSTVTVTVTDKDGGAGLATFGVDVANVPPTVTPPAAQTAGEGSAVPFALGSFSDPGALENPWAVAVHWGDGSQDTTFSLSAQGSLGTQPHTYQSTGHYSATVTVTNKDGGAGQATFGVDVANVAPTVTPPAAQSVAVNGSSSISLGSFSDPGVNDSPWSVTVDWGDSSTPGSFTTATQGSLGSLTHKYTNTGSYTLTVTVADSLGAKGSATGSVGVSTSTLQTITLDGTSYALVNAPVAFSLSNPNQPPPGGFTYSWNFGDGATATSTTPKTSHAYAAAGTYTTTVAVSDTLGDNASSSAPVTISSNSSDPLFKPVANQSSFSYLGSFALPRSANGWDTAYSFGGLASRYVNGNLQFFTTNHVYSGGLVYEFNYPGISTDPANLPQATVVQNWGDIYSGHKWVGNGGGNSVPNSSPGSNGSVSTYGLYYDQNGNRLYWNYGHIYNATNPDNPSIGYSTLNDATGVATGVGAWSLTGRPEKFDRGGVLQIPQWFANRYTGGDTLGVGFGGYFSIVATASFGPSLAAIAPPDPIGNPDRSSLANVPLLGYPTDAPDRGHRDTNYTSYYDSGTYPSTPGKWNPANGTGYWTWSDSIFDGGVWIDTPQMQGVLFIAKVGQGNVYYQGSDRHAQSGAFEWMVYNPADLAAVASGAKQQWQIQPQYAWTTPTLPFGPFDRNGYGGDGASNVGGIVFDPTTSRLYVLSEEILSNGSEGYPVMYVYQVGQPTSAPQVNFMSPAVETTAVDRATTATITFDRAMNPATLTSSTIFLQDSSNNLVSATVSYDATTEKATLRPNALLNPTTHYTVTVRGGTTGSVVQDALGNPLAADFIWSFTTGS